MLDYQTLLDKAVALVEPERGFVVQCDAIAGSCQYVALYDFVDATSGYKDAMFFDLLAARQPVLTDNSMIMDYLPPGVISTLTLRHILIVPLKNAGSADALLWCDRRFKRGRFVKKNLADLVALVQQEGWG